MIEVAVFPEHDARPPVLEVLPPELRQEMSSRHCVCRRRPQTLSDVQRTAHERVHADWIFLRVAWCDANGYLFSDLVRAEATPTLRLVRDH